MFLLFSSIAIHFYLLDQIQLSEQTLQDNHYLQSYIILTRHNCLQLLDVSFFIIVSEDSFCDPAL